MPIVLCNCSFVINKANPFNNLKMSVLNRLVTIVAKSKLDLYIIYNKKHEKISHIEIKTKINDIGNAAKPQSISYIQVKISIRLLGYRIYIIIVGMHV